jgi:hypothetical protein
LKHDFFFLSGIFHQLADFIWLVSDRLFVSYQTFSGLGKFLCHYKHQSLTPSQLHSCVNFHVFWMYALCPDCDFFGRTIKLGLPWKLKTRDKSLTTNDYYVA